MNVVLGIFWVLTMPGAVIGGFYLIFALGDSSAHRAASYAATVLAFAILPYCFTRALSEIGK